MFKTLIGSLCLTALLAASPAIAGSADEMMATLLNLKGYLCTRVVKINKLSQPDTYEVRCIEYRGGDGTVEYIVNVKTGDVAKR